MKKFLFYFFSILFGFVGYCFAEGENCSSVKLNTNVPFIGKEIKVGDNCQSDGTSTTASDAFPKLMAGMSKIVVSLILVLGFILIIVGGVMITMGGVDQAMVAKGKKLIMTVIVGIILLGTSGLILHMINPNFFK